MENSMMEIMEYLARGVRIQKNWEVTRIEMQGQDSILLTNSRGQSLKAQRVVVAVPLSVLKRGLRNIKMEFICPERITFLPPLPKKKQEAIKTISRFHRICS